MVSMDLRIHVCVVCTDEIFYGIFRPLEMPAFHPTEKLIFE